MQNYESDSDDELPSGWQETVSADGQVLYENIYEKIVQKNHPRTGYSKKVSESIPAGWKQIEKKEDEIVFVNEETGFETKVDPRLVFTKDVFDNKEFVQKFDSYSTALQVLSTHNLNNKIAIITGASAGIGLETAYSLMKHNWFVIFACRNRKKTEKAIEKLAENRFFNSNLCEIIHLDLASLESVKQFAKDVYSKYKRIDYLILNAAVFGINYERTIDGFETIFQVCHLSHFYLTLLIGKKLLGAGSRVIVLSSEAHRYATIFNGTTITKETLSPSSAKFYYHAFAYSNAKLLNILFANELSRKWSDRDISVFSVHPGNFVYSQFPNNSWFCKAVFFLLRPFTKSLQQAAATSVFAVVSENPDVFSGSYLNNCCLCPQSSTAANSHLAANIWSISESMILEKLGQTAYHM